MTDYGDLPRSELMREAQRALNANPGAILHFKYTCGGCGERRTLEEPNMLRDSGECSCGYDTPITEGGFMLIIRIAR